MALRKNFKPYHLTPNHGLLALAFCLILAAPLRAQLDETCRVTAMGQTVQVGPGGEFRFNNLVALQNVFRVYAVCTGSGPTRYGRSGFIEFVENQTFHLSELDMVWQNTPFPTIAKISAVPDAPTLTAIGQTTQMRVTAIFSDNASQDVTPRNFGSTYASSNPAIATINSEGLVTAMGKGTARITVSNEGATTVVRLTVEPSPPTTTVEGFVVLEDETPAAGAQVNIQQGGTGISEANGHFSISGVATHLGPLTVTAASGSSLFGLVSNIVPVPNGLTDAGVITLTNSIFWILNQNGDWNTAANWSGGAVPGANDHAVINAGNAITVTHAFGANTVKSLHSEEALKLSGGTLNLSEASEINGPFTLNGGTLGDGELALNGLFSWTGGAMSGAGKTIAKGGIFIQAGAITTVVGTGTAGYSGDGGPAITARINSPRNLFVDGLGNLYIADRLNHCIRKVTPGGIITTVAGTGVAGFSGDGGPATAATLREPTGVVVDAAGNLYFADHANHRIRKVDTGGIITTVAGTGVVGFSGDGGLATAARLNFPAETEVDAAGNLYIADQLNHRVRKVNTSGIITTMAGTGVAGFSGDGGPATAARFNGPIDLILDGPGNLYIADHSNHRIRKVDAGGIITTVAGTGVAGFSGDGGAATAANLNGPREVELDGAGNLYIVDTDNNRIRRVNTSGIITTVAGTGAAGFSGDGDLATAAQLDGPNGAAVDGSGNLYIADRDNHRIRKVFLNILLERDLDNARISTQTAGGMGAITTAAGTGTAGFFGDGGPATAARINSPRDVFMDGAGNLYIADFSNHRIRKVDASGIITTVAGTGVAGFSGDGGPATAARLNTPATMAVDVAGNLYIADQSNQRIRKVDAGGIITTFAGTGVAGFLGDGGPATSARLNFPNQIEFDGAGNVYISDQVNHRIRKVDAGGIITTFAGTGVAGFLGDGGPATSARLNEPSDVLRDGAGNFYINDRLNRRIRKIDTGGIITTIAGTGVAGSAGDGGPATSAQLNEPVRVALDGVGNLYIGDRTANRIRMVNTSGIITTVAGTGVAGFSGDGGPAILAQFNGCGGVAFDGSNNYYIVDQNNDRIRKVFSITAGSATWNGGGLTLSSGAVLTNLVGASFDIQGDLTNSGGSFNNNGTMIKSVGAGTATIGAAFTNTGTVESRSGMLKFTGTYTQTAGAAILNGGALQSTATFNIQGGSLSGLGTITANVSNTGQVRPGASAGVLNITGNYTQTFTGSLNIEIGGLTAGSQFDRLTISGSATLNGTLNLSLINGYEPNLGDSFTIMTFASRSGQFATINGLNIGNGKSFQATYNATNVTLTVVATGAER